MRTYFHDFDRDDGSHVTVEYSFKASSDTTYSPHSGACGGDPGGVEIVDVMPNTSEFEALCARHLDVCRVSPVLMGSDLREKLAELDAEIERAKKGCTLTDAENERMTQWLAEHHVDDDDGFDEDWEF